MNCCTYGSVIFSILPDCVHFLVIHKLFQISSISWLSFPPPFIYSLTLYFELYQPLSIYTLHVIDSISEIYLVYCKFFFLYFLNAILVSDIIRFQFPFWTELEYLNGFLYENCTLERFLIIEMYFLQLCYNTSLQETSVWLHIYCVL